MPVDARNFTAVAMRPGVATKRHIPKKLVMVPQGMPPPLVHPKDAAERQIQEVWHARINVFDLRDSDQLKAYQDIWQKVVNTTAVVSEHRVDFDQQHSTYKVYIRWSEFEYVAPS